MSVSYIRGPFAKFVDQPYHFVEVLWPFSKLGYGMGDRGFESRQGLGIFPFTTATRPALGPTNLLSSGYRALSLGVKRPEREADHSPPSTAEAKE